MNIDTAKHMLKSYSGMTHKMTDNNGRPKLDQAIETILNELEKKEKIMQKVINYTYQEIEYYDEDIADYIDDDRNENKNIIDNLKEDREQMLKIKDDVDLKELERFGLEETIEDWILYNDLGDDRYNPNVTYYELEICIKNAKEYGEEYQERVLYTNCGYIPSIVYDLIQAGLVEKVEQN